MANEMNPKHIDRRTQARYVARGVITEKDLEKHLKSLPDVAANSTKVDTEQPTGDSAPTR